MSDPMKTLDALITARKIEHDGNPAMTWMLSNVVSNEDAKENVYPRKLRGEDKIDGPVALIMAIGRHLAATAAPAAEESIYNERARLGLPMLRILE